MGAGHVIDHQMSKIRLPGDWADRGEFRRGKAHAIGGSGVRIIDFLQNGLVRRRRNAGFGAKGAQIIVLLGQ